MRIPNIFNLSNKILDRVDPPKIKHDFPQQSSHEIDISREDEIMESDLFRQEDDSGDNIKTKTVHIE